MKLLRRKLSHALQKSIQVIEVKHYHPAYYPVKKLGNILLTLKVEEHLSHKKLTSRFNRFISSSYCSQRRFIFELLASKDRTLSSRARV